MVEGAFEISAAGISGIRELFDPMLLLRYCPLLWLECGTLVLENLNSGKTKHLLQHLRVTKP